MGKEHFQMNNEAKPIAWQKRSAKGVGENSSALKSRIHDAASCSGGSSGSTGACGCGSCACGTGGGECGYKPEDVPEEV